MDIQIQGGLWEKRLESALGLERLCAVLPEIWAQFFTTQSLLGLLLVVYADFKPFGRCFGCQHVEKNGVKLAKDEHPFRHVFDGSTQHASVCQTRRTEGYWEHESNAAAQEPSFSP